MLSPAQVLPFLEHEDQYVRRLATQYFATAQEPSPASAEDIWKVIDAWGWGTENSEIVVAATELPQTEHSLRRLAEAIATAPDEQRESLEGRLAFLPFGVLNRYRDIVESAPLSDKAKKRIADRFDLSTKSPNELWDVLLKYTSDLEQDKTEFDQFYSLNLAEALARHPEASQWALNELNQGDDVTWLKIMCVDLLGFARERHAAELIASYYLKDLRADYMMESATDALKRIGGVTVVDAIRNVYPKMDDGQQFYVIDVLASIKLPQAEALLANLLGTESTQSYRTALAAAACRSAATDPSILTTLRTLISEDTWDKTLFDLDELVVALFLMVKNEIPELPQWRKSLDDVSARRAATRKAHLKQMKKAFKAVQSNLEDVDFEDLSWPMGEEPPMPTAPMVVNPIRRGTAKVGRNDPCPCGSGKKYKKCCGK